VMKMNKDEFREMVLNNQKKRKAQAKSKDLLVDLYVIERYSKFLRRGRRP
jgi:hypothetical protein